MKRVSDKYKLNYLYDLQKAKKARRDKLKDTSMFVLLSLIITMIISWFIFLACWGYCAWVFNGEVNGLLVGVFITAFLIVALWLVIWSYRKDNLGDKNNDN